MWDVRQPEPVKLIVGILAADEDCRARAIQGLSTELGPIDLMSQVWPFTQTHYYDQEIGSDILRQFVSLDQLVHPGDLAQIKHQTNTLEQDMAKELTHPRPRPINLDPGFIEPSKLVLASTKNFSHRIYIGKNMYAEVTLIVDKGQWCALRYTFPDYRQSHYYAFFEQVRQRLRTQLRVFKENRM
jgi:hypothetical protein